MAIIDEIKIRIDCRPQDVESIKGVIAPQGIPFRAVEGRLGASALELKGTIPTLFHIALECGRRNLSIIVS